MPHPLYILNTFLHILAAACWVGGNAFLVLVLFPLLRRQTDRARAIELVRAVGQRLRGWAWGWLLVLMATGTVNLYARGYLPPGPAWETREGNVMAAKLWLVALILACGLVHDFVVGPGASLRARHDPDSPDTRRWRAWAAWLGRTTFAASLIVVALAVMIVRGVPW